MAGKRKGLGKGLDALLGAGLQLSAPTGDSAQAHTAETAGSAKSTESAVDGRLAHLPVELIERGKYQPRRDMHPGALEELADSIRAQGVMQPIGVRPVAEDRYESIAGARRWRAAQLAEPGAVPAVIREVSEEVALAQALGEHRQREG